MEIPTDVQSFLSSPRIAVAGVSRDSGQAANAIFRRLRDEGFAVVPVNPNADRVEGVRAWPSISAIPTGDEGASGDGGPVQAVVVATHPEVSEAVVRDGAAAGARWFWFHRSFGQGSVSPGALAACRELGVGAIEGGCPMMFVGKVDVAHACMRWFLQRRGRVPR